MKAQTVYLVLNLVQVRDLGTRSREPLHAPARVFKDRDEAQASARWYEEVVPVSLPIPD